MLKLKTNKKYNKSITMIRGKSPQYEQNSKLQVDYDDAREITPQYEQNSNL